MHSVGICKHQSAAPPPPNLRWNMVGLILPCSVSIKVSLSSSFPFLGFLLQYSWITGELSIRLQCDVGGESLCGREPIHQPFCCDSPWTESTLTLPVLDRECNKKYFFNENFPNHTQKKSVYCISADKVVWYCKLANFFPVLIFGKHTHKHTNWIRSLVHQGKYCLPRLAATF